MSTSCWDGFGRCEKLHKNTKMGFNGVMMVPHSWRWVSWILTAILWCRRMGALSLYSSHPNGNHHKWMQRLTRGYWPIRRRRRWWWSWRFCVQFKLPLHLWHNLSASNFHRMGNFGGFLKRELQQQESRSRRDVKQKTQVGCWFEFYGATGIAHLMLKFS